MKHIIFTSLALATALISAQQCQNEIDATTQFEKSIVPGNIKLDKLDLNKSTKLSNGWCGVQFNIEASGDNGQKFKFQDTLFSNGTEVSKTLFSKSGNDYMQEMMPTFPSSGYDKNHLVYGDIKAKNKIVFMSDPKCPYCVDKIPALIEHLNKRDDVAIFIYAMPLPELQGHSDSKEISIEIAKAKIAGNKNAFVLAYNTISKSFKDQKPLTTKDISTLLKTSSKHLKEATQMVDGDIKLTLENEIPPKTPTIFVNGKYDMNGKLLQDFGK
jgi:thiol:disulfide interchange protein DsbC